MFVILLVLSHIFLAGVEIQVCKLALASPVVVAFRLGVPIFGRVFLSGGGDDERSWFPVRVHVVLSSPHFSSGYKHRGYLFSATLCFGCADWDFLGYCCQACFTKNNRVPPSSSERGKGTEVTL